MKILLRSGFTLIELLIYTALTTIFALFVFGFVGSMRQQIENMKNLSSRQLTVLLGLDLIKRDLISSDMYLSSWDKNSGVFAKSSIDEKSRVPKTCVGWYAVKNGLQRWEGEYDFKERRWKKKTTSFYGCPITQVKFNVYTQEVNKKYVDLVEISYTVFQEKEHHDYVRLRNRVLV